MTVQTNTTIATGIGNGVTSVFPITFKFNRAEDLIVYLVDEETEAETPLTLYSDYTIDGAGTENGGTLTLLAGPLPIGQSVVAQRIVDLRQLTDLRNQGRFFAEVHEDVFDKLVMIDQQQQTQLDRSMVVDLLWRWNALNRRIINVGDPVADKDATHKRYVDQGDSDSRQYADDRDAHWVARSLRTPDPVSPLPGPESRANRLLSFDVNGRPVAVAPQPQSATELAMRLADPHTPGNAAEMVAFTRKPIADAVGATISRILTSIELSIVEFNHLVDMAGPEPWDWTSAAMAGYASLMAMGGGVLRFPKGRFKVSGSGIQTIDSNSYYRISDYGVRFVGEGFATRLTRGKDSPTDLIDRGDPATFHKSVFNLHSSNNEYDNFVCEDSESAFYLGQRYGAPVDSCHVSMNKFSRIWVRNCGIAFHMRSGLGCYYNIFSDIHVWGCQIGEYIDSHPDSATQVIPNNNRNQFRHLRNARCHVGLWLESGDTNQFFGQHNEGCTATPSQNRYPAPEDLPYGNSSGIGQITGERGTNNQFVACMQEANGTDLINSGIRNSFSGLYGDEVTGKVRHIVLPSYYQTRTMSVTNQGRTFSFTNPQTDVFEGKAPGQLHNTLPVRATAHFLDVTGGDQRTQYSTEFSRPIPPMAAESAVDIPLWTETTIESNCTAVFELKIVLNCSDTNLGYFVTLQATAYRSGSRALSGLYVFNKQATRTGGTGTDEVGAMLVTGGSNSRDLLLRLTAPPRLVSSGVAVVQRIISK